MYPGHWLVILGVFAVAGPVIGTLIFVVLMMAASAVGAIPAELAPLVGYGALILLPLTFVIGGVQAVGSGLAVALWMAARRRDTPWWLPAGVAAAGSGFYLGRTDFALGEQAIVLAVHVLAAVACWGIAMRLLRDMSPRLP